MKKVLTNYITDTVIFAVLASQVFTGIILHRFPPEMAGATVLGLTRYTWGTLHWLVSLIFIVIVILHLLLHWGWIKTLTRKYMNRGSVVFLVIAAAAFLFAFLTPYYVTKDMPKRKEFSGIYQETTYYEAERIHKEMWGVSLEPHLISGPWRINPQQSK